MSLRYFSKGKYTVYHRSNLNNIWGDDTQFPIGQPFEVNKPVNNHVRKSDLHKAFEHIFLKSYKQIKTDDPYFNQRKEFIDEEIINRTLQNEKLDFEKLKEIINKNNEMYNNRFIHGDSQL